MAKIEFPQPLKDLLENSDLQAPIRAFADRIGEIVADNKLPFFPAYTDHGADHINRVLESEIELIPVHVWKLSEKGSKPRILCDADAAVIIGATLLHDIAMHLHPDGFRELIRPDSRFQPLPWFKEDQEDHAADRPWHELWDEYAREARRFSDRKLADIVGQESVRQVWKFHKLPEDCGQWMENDRLIIGEFIRRHHARLAHEIAIYGFPGIPAGSGEGQFPAMCKESGHPLRRLADLIGVAARSHGTSLRISKTYIESSPSYRGTPRPMGSAVLYPMALLRVADYLQIDRQRAPSVLLQLKNPQSPVSVHEWEKHLAVLDIGPATDPRGKMVTISTDIGLELYLQLKELLTGLQTEMDHATAVLDEAYGARADLGLNQLNLAIRRMHSNLNSPAFRDSLPYIPERTGYSADPNLLTLLVEPLYGKHPGVGVRELIQNAVDAVRELDAWSKTHGKDAVTLELPEQEADVLIDFIKREDDSWFLRVRDKGIGMAGDTLQNYFLRAGASFRQSVDWAKEFLDDDGKPRVLRAGRFGVGAFAAFLLGPTFRLQTRHADAPSSMSYLLEASKDSQLIEIRRIEGLPIGTIIEVELAVESVTALELNEEKYSEYSGPGRRTDWFCWDWPKIARRVTRSPTPEMLEPEYSATLCQGKPGLEWSLIRPKGFDAVYWTFIDAPDLVCNGLKISNEYGGKTNIGWPEETQLGSPKLAVLDGAAMLPLTTQRYELSQDAVPFIDDLARDVTLSYIAHALVCGPVSREEALSSHATHPLAPELAPINRGLDESLLTKGYLRWCITPSGMVPADSWLYSFLGANSCLVYGAIARNQWRTAPYIPSLDQASLSTTEKTDRAMLYWHINNDKGYFDDADHFLRKTAESSNNFLEKLVRNGLETLGHQTTSSNIVVLANRELDIEACHEEFRYFHEDEDDNLAVWHKTSKPNASWQRFEAQHGSLAPTIALEPLISTIETAAANDDYDNDPPDLMFVAEIQAATTPCSPKTLLAKIWNECLGPKIIPFDSDARKALIEHGRRHPELKRHIEAWEEMKRTGSKWASITHENRHHMRD
jgi:hypothetical protein